MKNLITILTLLIVLSFNSGFTPNSEAIDRIRKRVVENAKEYSATDVERVKTLEELIKGLSADANNEEDVIKQIDTIFKWRKSNINKEFTDTSFPLETYKSGFASYLGTDQGNKVVFLLKYNKWYTGSSKFTQLYKQFLLYLLEKYVTVDPKNELILICDGSDISISNIDMDLFFFIVTSAAKYYPDIKLSLIGTNLPTFLDNPIKVVLSAAGKIGATAKTIAPKEIHKYVDSALLPPSLLGTNTMQLNTVPAGCKPLEAFDRVQFTSDDVKDIYRLFKGFK